MCLIVASCVEDIKKQLGYIIGALMGGDVDKKTTTLFHLHTFLLTLQHPLVTIFIAI